jgi:plasmid stabilization system protein ParE
MKSAGFAPGARDEFDAAVEWYESQSAGLGWRFVEAIDEIVTRIRELPDGFPTWEEDRRFRKAVVRRFPYVLFYRELTEAIEVVAVAHGARGPGYWLKRT